MLRDKKMKRKAGPPVRRASRKVATPGARKAPAEATLGILVGIGPAGEAWVDLPRPRRKNVPARSTVALASAHIGREVLITWIDGDRDQPVILGIIQGPGDASGDAVLPRVDAIVDAERIVLSGRREVVLRCGKASIALAADGSVAIKGARLLTSASGVHRIRGGAVQIN